MIYLDYSATTPVNEEVLDTFCQVTKRFIGNPNSLHKLGMEAKDLIVAATKQIEDILDISNSDIIYTSGASEANNTAIKGVCFRYKNRGRHIITTKLEHSSVLETVSYMESLGFSVSYVSLLENGEVDLNNLEELMTDDTILVSICSVNSEVGVRQPINEISKIVKKYPKCYFHSDMTQSIGKEKISLEGVDFVSFSAQKFFGIKGIGCLIKNKSIVIDPLIHGGKSTTVYRSGTPAISLIASLSKALRLSYQDIDKKYMYVLELNKYLIDKLRNLDVDINSNDKCIPHIVNISLRNIKPETMVHALEEEDIYISTRTACSSSDFSLAVYSITGDMEVAKRSMRISISPLTTKEELDKFVLVFSKKLKELEEVNEKNS